MPKSGKWYERPLRIAAMQCNFEDNLPVLDVWKETGFNTEQLLHLFGEGYYGAFVEERHGQALRQYLDRAHALGIRIIAYANTHMMGDSMQDRAEAWGARHPDDALQMGYRTFVLACPNGPWLDWMCEGLQRLAQYEIDGVFSDGPMGACWCKQCRAAFAKAYGYPLPDAPAAGSKEARDVAAFDVDTRAYCVKRLREAVKSVRPEAVFYQNLHIWGLPHRIFEPLNDIVASEGGFMFYGPPAEGYLWKTSLCAKVLEACAKGKPTVIFAAGDQKPWSWYLHSPGETELMYAASVANNASVWYGIHCTSGNMQQPGGQAAAAMNRFHAENEDVYTKTFSLAAVRILHAEASRMNYHASEDASDFYKAAGAGAANGVGDVNASTEAFAAMLYRNQIPFDFLAEEALDTCEPSGALILPTAACLSDAHIDAIRRFVSGGGLLIASLDSSLFDEHGRKRIDFGLADVFGVSLQEGGYDFQNYNYFEVEAPDHPLLAGVHGGLIPAPNYGLKIAAAAAEVLGTYRAPLPGVYVPMTEPATPAVTLNVFGKGHCLYWAGTFGEFYRAYATREYAQIVANAIATHAPAAIVIEGAPPSVEMVLRQEARSSRVYIHLINYTGGMTRPIERPVPLHDLALRADVARLGFTPQTARALRSGQGLTLSFEGATVGVELPVLQAYEVVALE